MDLRPCREFADVHGCELAWNGLRLRRGESPERRNRTRSRWRGALAAARDAIHVRRERKLEDPDGSRYPHDELWVRQRESTHERDLPDGAALDLRVRRERQS